jgi:hypothetical protein
MVNCTIESEIEMIENDRWAIHINKFIHSDITLFQMHVDFPLKGQNVL